MWTVLYWAIVFLSGFMLGYIVKGWITRRFRDYSGTIVVDTDHFREKTVYSLVLDEYPEKLEFKKEVVFRVDTSGQSSNRK